MFFEDEYEIINSSDIKEAIEFTSRLNPLTNDSHVHMNFFYEAIKKVLNGGIFNEECLAKQKLYLCEAYVLLCHHTVTRSLNTTELKIGVNAAMLIDLHGQRKICIEEKINQATSELYVKVINDEPTFTFLDRVIFQQILRHAQITAMKPRKLTDWLASSSDNDALTACLLNLKSRGILSCSGDTNPAIAQKYSVANIGPLQQLEKEIKAISLNEKRPDSFFLAILTLLYNINQQNSFFEQILGKICSKRETKVSVENVKIIVNTQGLQLKSGKFIRKKFSMDKPNYINVKMSSNQLSPIPGSPPAHFA